MKEKKKEIKREKAIVVGGGVFQEKGKIEMELPSGRIHSKRERERERAP